MTRQGRPRPRIRVLVVDDSAVARAMVERMLGEAEDIHVVGGAADPYEARALIAELAPDVLVLDVEMPRMDGLTFLKKLMLHRPMPVVMLTSMGESGGTVAVRAFELGAIDVICKPTSSGGVDPVRDALIAAVRSAGRSRPPADPAALEHVDAALPSRGGGDHVASPDRIIAIGASTGGPQATDIVLRSFGADAPPIVIVQHMNSHFLAAYAARLDERHAIDVRLAETGMRLCPGLALVAPGGWHLGLKRRGEELVAHLQDSAPLHHQRPAIDVTFRALAKLAGPRTIGVLLTGMGRDGADGLLAIKEAGGVTVAQDEASSVVYGMPRVAAEIGAVQHPSSLSSIGGQVLRMAARD